MNKRVHNPAIVYCVLLLVAQINSLTLQNALDFGEGFAFGLSGTVMNITACKQDFVLAVSSFKAGFESLDKGFHLVDSHEAILGIKEIGLGIANTSKSLIDCGVLTSGLGLATIGIEVYEGKLIYIIAREAILDLFHKNHPITSNIKNAIDNWNAGNYYNAGANVGILVGLLLTDASPLLYLELYEKGFNEVVEIFHITEIEGKLILDWGKENAGKTWNWTTEEAKEVEGKVADGAKDIWGKVAEGTKDAAGKVAEGAKDAAGKVAEGTKDAAGKVAEGTKDAAGKVAEGTKDVAGKVAEGTKDVAEKVAEGAKDAAGKVADGAKDAAGKVAEGAKDVAHKVGGWFGF